MMLLTPNANNITLNKEIAKGRKAVRPYGVN